MSDDGKRNDAEDALPALPPLPNLPPLPALPPLPSITADGRACVECDKLNAPGAVRCVFCGAHPPHGRFRNADGTPSAAERHAGPPRGPRPESN